MSQVVLITGASSGLGLAFLKHYASDPNTWHVIALDYTPLPESPVKIPVEFYHADVTNEGQIKDMASRLSQIPIDLLIYCAGVRGLVKSVVQERKEGGGSLGEMDVAAAETMEVMNRETMMQTLEINTFGTFNFLRAFAPNLRMAEHPKAVILSSRMGSLSSNVAGGAYAYRASKAALNAVVRSFSIDVPEVTYLLLHPGRVETGLVQWKEEGAISVEESLKDCLRVIDRLMKEESGMFVDRFGAKIDW
jgi:NAD(P)-dependent dehydrogenase (short-subunit alcohol dehydrogenase family)